MGDETVTFFCEKCNARFDISSEKIGKQFICKKCHQVITVPEQSQSPPVTETPPKKKKKLSETIQETKKILKEKIRKKTKAMASEPDAKSDATQDSPTEKSAKSPPASKKPGKLKEKILDSQKIFLQKVEHLKKRRKSSPPEKKNAFLDFFTSFYFRVNRASGSRNRTESEKIVFSRHKSAETRFFYRSKTIETSCSS